MKPKQFFYGLAGTAVVVLLGAAYMYWSSVSSLGAKSRQLGQLLADVKLAQDKSDQLKALGADYDQRVKPKLKALGILLPRDKDQAKIADQVNAVARSSGVTVSGLTFASTGEGSVAVAGPAQSVPVSFVATGSYSQFQQFLQGMENFPRLSDITSLGLTKSGTGNDVTANLTLNVYYKP